MEKGKACLLVVVGALVGLWLGAALSSKETWEWVRGGDGSKKEVVYHVR